MPAKKAYIFYFLLNLKNKNKVFCVLFERNSLLKRNNVTQGDFKAPETSMWNIIQVFHIAKSDIYILYNPALGFNVQFICVS